MKLILILLVCFSVGVQASSLCSQYKKPKAYLDFKKSTEKEIQKFSQKKVIAEKADATLSKLIKAKSPLITTWMKKRNLESKSEVEIANAWREYFAFNFILSKYPSAEAKINAEMESLIDSLIKKNFDKKYKEKITSLFEQAKKLSLQTVEKMEISGKKEVSGRISQIQLYWPETLKTAKNNSLPLDIVDWGIAYSPQNNEVNMGLDALAYSSDEAILSVFAHEIGHSFDSCRWGEFFKGAWPFEKVGSCLRSKESVEAKVRNDSKLERLKSLGLQGEMLYQFLKSNPTCNKLEYPPIGQQADQLPEVFADWFAAEVMSIAEIKNIAEVRSDLCETRDLVEGSSYISNQNRLERIYFVQPGLKEKLKSTKPSGAVYCNYK